MTPLVTQRTLYGIRTPSGEIVAAFGDGYGLQIAQAMKAYQWEKARELMYWLIAPQIPDIVLLDPPVLATEQPDWLNERTTG